MVIAALIVLSSCGNGASSQASSDSCTEYLGSPEAARESTVASLGAQHEWSLATSPLSGFRTVDSICANSSGQSPEQIIIRLACDEGNCGTRDAAEAEVAAAGGVVGSGYLLNGVELPMDRVLEACDWFRDDLIRLPNDNSWSLRNFWEFTLSEPEKQEFGDVGQFTDFLNYSLEERCDLNNLFLYDAAEVLRRYEDVGAA